MSEGVGAKAPPESLLIRSSPSIVGRAAFMGTASALDWSTGRRKTGPDPGLAAHDMRLCHLLVPVDVASCCNGHVRGDAERLHAT